MIHQILGLCVIGTLRRYHVPPGLAVAIGSLVMIGTAWLMFLFVEERGRDWVLEKAGRLRAARAWLRGDRGKGKLPAP